MSDDPVGWYADHLYDAAQRIIHGEPLTEDDRRFFAAACPLVAYSAETTSSETFTVNETKIGSVTFNRESGCTYLIGCNNALAAGSGHDIVQLNLVDDQGRYCSSLRFSGLFEQRRRHPHDFPLQYRYHATEAGPVTFALTAQRIVGTTNIWRNASPEWPQLIQVHEQL